MTLMVEEETFSKGTHVRCGEKEMLPLGLKCLLRNKLNLLRYGHPWIWWGLGVQVLAGQGESVPSPCTEAQTGRGIVSRAAFPPPHIFLRSTSVKR